MIPTITPPAAGWNQKDSLVPTRRGWCDGGDHGLVRAAIAGRGLQTCRRCAERRDGAEAGGGGDELRIGERGRNFWAESVPWRDARRSCGERGQSLFPQHRGNARCVRA